jgi:predicted transcriptional regulator
MEKTTVYIPNATRRALQEEGRRSGRSQAELIREALTDYLARRPRPLPRSLGIAADGKVTGRRSEAWIRREWSRR